MSATPPKTENSDSRNRLSISLSGDLDAALDHVSDVLGIPKASLCVQAVVDAIPTWLDRADTVRKAVRAGGKPIKR